MPIRLLFNPFLLSLLFLSLVPSFIFAQSGSLLTRPNIVLLISEDNSKHYLKHFDPNGAPTPHIEKLASQGITFTRAFSNFPVCSAARSVLATGCYGSRIGTQFHRKYKPVPLPDGLAPIAALMRKAGYYTSNKTKTDYNFTFKGPSWHSKKDWHGRKPGQPFFHKQSFGVSHESALHRANTGGTDQKTFVAPCHPNTPLFRQANLAYKRIVQRMDTQIGTVVSRLKKEGLLEQTFIFYFGDHGGVLPGSKGYAYETGLHIPLVVRIPEKYQHLVPLKPNTRSNAFISFIDFAPTILNLAGIPIPNQMDGKPFLGKGVTQKNLSTRDETFGFADRFDEKYDFVRTIRKANFKYIRSYQPFNFDGLWNNYRYRMKAYKEWWTLFKAGKLNKQAALFFQPRPAEALYDISKDPYEVNNLAADPAHVKTLADLRNRLTQKMKSLPDLSFYPESHLAKHAFSNPTQFGHTHKSEIAKLIDIANLSLLPFPKAKPHIQSALTSSNPWHRYWALIACSSFSKQASQFINRAKTLAAKDPEPLVRVRAAEFLALIGAADSRPVLMDVLATANHPLEALLTLNTVVLLRDGKPGYKFNITQADIRTRDALISRRLEYLIGKPAKRRPKRNKRKNQQR